jgi:hypothetical protein
MAGEKPAEAGAAEPDPLPEELAALLTAARDAERAIFAALDDARMGAPMPNDTWSPGDVLGHLAAWRGIEARRLLAMAGRAAPAADDPALTDDVDEANARLRDARLGRSRAEIEAEAEESTRSLLAAIRASTTEMLCECDDLSAGIGANGVNHAIGHLGDISRLAGREDAFWSFGAVVEQVLHRAHLLPRDAGVMLYNLACNRAVAGDLDDARRLLRGAFAWRPDLLEWSHQDPDVAALEPELDALAAS